MSEKVEQKVTRGFKTCRSCSNGMQDQDRYCRRCGTYQSKLHTKDELVVAQSEQIEYLGSVGVATAPLSKSFLAGTNEQPAGPYRSLSGSLLNAVASGMYLNSSNDLSGQAKTGMARRVMAALLSVPIWLIIIMLSPLDAYLATRTLLR
jgi:RNA polymerase subunit RPABC4/transcription elongation factor Spt4